MSHTKITCTKDGKGLVASRIMRAVISIDDAAQRIDRLRNDLDLLDVRQDDFDKDAELQDTLLYLRHMSKQLRGVLERDGYLDQHFDREMANEATND
ncbi:MAG: hypothetical protein AAF709_26240 [Pseudomonadota bacterium]